VSAHALCDHCARLKKVTAAGVVERHFVKIPEQVRNIARSRKVRRQCPGSGRPPRRPA
jgi:hypothetical protein